MRSHPSSLRAGGLLGTVLLAAPGPLHAAHPFITDDTGTQGSGNWQLEALGQYDRGDRVADPGGGPVQQRSRLSALNPVLSYGLLENLDLSVGLYYGRSRVSENGVPVEDVSGMSDSSLELKWRFFERDGFSLAVKPGLLLPTGDENRGLGTGRTSWGVNLIAGYAAEPWALMGNVAYFQARFRLPQDEAANRRDLWRVSGGAAYAVNASWKLTGELAIRTNPARDDPFAPGRTGQFAMLGAIYSPSDKIDLDVGLRKRLHRAEPDTTFLLGATFRW